MRGSFDPWHGDGSTRSAPRNGALRAAAGGASRRPGQRRLRPAPSLLPVRAWVACREGTVWLCHCTSLLLLLQLVALACYLLPQSVRLPVCVLVRRCRNPPLPSGPHRVPALWVHPGCFLELLPRASSQGHRCRIRSLLLFALQAAQPSEANFQAACTLHDGIGTTFTRCVHRLVCMLRFSAVWQCSRRP